jgi:hypothetical protein
MPEPTHKTPRDICEELKIGMDPVLAWIHSKQLKASNVSNSNTRPRWRIAKADLASFLEQRSNQQKREQKPSRRSKKPKKKYV